MPRSLKPKPLTRITPAREGSTYQLETEDEAGKRVLFQLTAHQALLLAEQLDDLLAAEEEELKPEPWDCEVVQPHQRLWLCDTR
jgi:hypothetical protein